MARPSKGKRRPAPVIRRQSAARHAGRFAGWIAVLQRQPPWVTSLATHSGLAAVCALLSFATLGEPALSLTASLGEDAVFEEPAEVVLADLPADDAPLDDTEATLAEVTLAVEELVQPLELTPLVDVGVAATLDASDLMGEVGSPVVGAEANGEGEGRGRRGGGGTSGGGRVSFFGAQTEADRVAFVVDNSGSMQRGRLETTLLELDAAVGRLSASQEFYVVFFSDQAYPMFFPDGVDEPIDASGKNKRRLSRWLASVEMCLGGRLLDAMEMAARVEPDAVYLLTDGDIRSERIIAQMTTAGAWDFPIHTLGMGARTPRHAEVLLTIASRSGGTYRPVAAHPAAVRRSQERPIRYHRETGQVWGSAVRAWN